MQRITYALIVVISATAITACALDGQDEQGAQSTQVAPEQSAAVSTGLVCESYGGQRCVGAPTIAFDDPVQETASGRVLQNSVSGNQVKFPFNAASNKCVAVANNGALVEVRSCDVPSAVWIEHLGPDGVSCIFQNQQFGLYLSGPDNGGQFHLETKGANGWLQQFHLFNGLSSAVCS